MLQEAQEKKRQEQLSKKAENSKLYEEEMSSLKSAKPAGSDKVTRYEIEQQKAKQAADGRQENSSYTVSGNFPWINFSLICDFQYFHWRKKITFSEILDMKLKWRKYSLGRKFC